MLTTGLDAAKAIVCRSDMNIEWLGIGTQFM
jgi:hypothetical protein